MGLIAWAYRAFKIPPRKTFFFFFFFTLHDQHFFKKLPSFFQNFFISLNLCKILPQNFSKLKAQHYFEHFLDIFKYYLKFTKKFHRMLISKKLLKQFSLLTENLLRIFLKIVKTLKVLFKAFLKNCSNTEEGALHMYRRLFFSRILVTLT